MSDAAGGNLKPEKEAAVAIEKIMNVKTISTQPYQKLAKDTKAWSYDMEGHALQCVERYCELAGKELGKLKQYDTPCIDDHQLKPEDFELKGQVSETAANIVLTVLYLARIGRPDLLWTVNAVTKWTLACDKLSLIHI